MASITIKVSAKDIRNAVKKRVSGPIIALTKNPDVLRSIAEEAIKIVDPYVPMKSGDLSSSGHVAQHARSTTITWGQAGIGKTGRYARYQHDADDSMWKRTRTSHPLAKSNWTEEIEYGSPGFEKLVDYATSVMKKEIRNDSR